MLSWAIPVTLAAVLVSMLLTVVRLARGPSVADRVVALDILAVLFVAVAALMALDHRESTFLDVAMSLALVAFLGSVALARYVESAATEPRDGHDSDGGRP